MAQSGLSAAGRSMRSPLAPEGPPDARAQPRHQVLVVASTEIVRLGIASMIADTRGFAVCARSASYGQALQMTTSAPAVIVAEAAEADPGATRFLGDAAARFPSAKVVFVMRRLDDFQLARLIRGGLAGCVSAKATAGDLASVLQAVVKSENAMDAGVTTFVFDRIRRSGVFGPDPLLEKLTPQERRILKLISEGRTNVEISLEMTLSPKTVKNYVSRILMKLGVQRRAEAAVYWVQRDAS